MARILAFDYGTKRIGIAVTDPMQIIAKGMTTLHPDNIIKFLKEYLSKEKVECFVVGEPKRLNNQPTQLEPHIRRFIVELKKNFADIPVERIDERFTSRLASGSMIEMGIKKRDRREHKEWIDEISAALILQSYLQRKNP